MLAATPQRQDRQWRKQPERGSLLGLQLLADVSDHLGREFVGYVLWPVCLYFALTAKKARAASEQHLRHMGIEPTLHEVVRHLWTFARVSADRYFFLTGRIEEFTLRHFGHEHMLAMAHDPERRGGLLLGAHLGSFEAMRVLAKQHDLRTAVVVDFGNAQRINSMLQSNPRAVKLDVIAADPEHSTWMLEAKAHCAQGGLVALLADREHGNHEERRHAPRTVEVDFLGGRARIPTGAFLLAHVCQCPVYLVFALFDGDRGYDLYCIPFADRVQLPRQNREQALTELAQRYADRLADHTKLAPYNWFNFYEYWSDK